jgi:chromosome condensin MukBEF ATPase and DNA-binding subunit MukB
MFSFLKNEKRLLAIEKRMSILESENVDLKKTLYQASVDLSNIDTILRATVFAQTQLADDIREIYEALKSALDPEDYYSKHMLKFGPDDDDGGLLN